MYNGAGLRSSRGTATSGYVIRPVQSTHRSVDGSGGMRGYEAKLDGLLSGYVALDLAKDIRRLALGRRLMHLRRVLESEG